MSKVNKVKEKVDEIKSCKTISFKKNQAPFLMHPINKPIQEMRHALDQSMSALTKNFFHRV